MLSAADIPTSRRRSILLASVVLLLVIPLIWILWPAEPLDLSKDEEPFKSMRMPPRSVTGDIIMDGGSVLVTVIDQAGNPFEFHFWIDTEKVFNSRPTAGYGTKIGGKSILLKDPVRAKIIAIRLLEDYGSKRDLGTSHALNGLSDPAGEISERLYGKARKRLYEWTGF